MFILYFIIILDHIREINLSQLIHTVNILHSSQHFKSFPAVLYKVPSQIFESSIFSFNNPPPKKKEFEEHSCKNLNLPLYMYQYMGKKFSTIWKRLKQHKVNCLNTKLIIIAWIVQSTLGYPRKEYFWRTLIGAFQCMHLQTFPKSQYIIDIIDKYYI